MVCLEEFTKKKIKNGYTILLFSQAGYDLDDAVFTMTEISSQTTGATATAVDIGDSFTYNMRLDLPGVDVSAKSDLSVEIFGMMPGQGTWVTKTPLLWLCT